LASSNSAWVWIISIDRDGDYFPELMIIFLLGVIAGFVLGFLLMILIAVDYKSK